MTTMQGVIHGKMIELEREPGLPDGEGVKVTIERAISRPPAAQSSSPSYPQWPDRLIFDPSILPGERIVKGTRLSAEGLVAELAKGVSATHLMNIHPELSQADIDAINEYARLAEGLRKSFGAWADESDEVDRFVEETYRLRGDVRESIQNKPKCKLKIGYGMSL